MAFCRRCGEIVVSPRCKCGGAPVAAAVKWGHTGGQAQDRWSQTYVTKENTTTRPAPAHDADDETADASSSVPPASPPGPTRRFPRPASSFQTAPVVLGSRVSAHIASTTARAGDPPKQTATLSDYDGASSSNANAAAGILPNPNGSELAKVYGSVLQPKETLDSYCCAICYTPFPPDATIYPDPSSLSATGSDSSNPTNSRFLCRGCFVANGGTKGVCPSCDRPVLILKSEGGFVESGGRAWHKRCFCCDGCLKNIGDTPMVDLLGRPCCADCFDSCLKRSPRDGSQRRTGPSDEDLRSNLGGTKRVDRENEGSSALSELEQRLGIVRARDNTPVKEGARTMPVTPTTTYSPVATRYTPRNIGEPSPVVERLAERARSDSYTRMGSAPVSHSTGGSTYAERVAHNLKSTEAESSSLDSVSPLPPRRTFSYRSPGLGDGPSDGGLVRRRTHNRGKSMDPDIFSNPIPRVGSPRFSSPSSSKQPSEEAIEAMKNRFLRMASPGPSSGPNLTNTGSALQPTTPKSRWRSRPRYSQASLTGDAATGSVDLSGTIRLSDLRRSSYHSSQSSVLRDRTGDTEPILARDRTGDTDEPLGRDRTGDMRYHLRRDRTGDSEVQQRSNMRRSATGDVNLTLRRDRTGDAEVASLLDNGMIGTFNNGEASGPMTAIPDAGDTPSARRDSVASSSLGRAYEQSVPSTPDLAGDFSDTASTAPSSTPPTPHSVSPSARQSLDYADGLRKRGITGQAADYHNSRPRHPNDNPTPSHTPKSQSLPGGFPVSSPLPLSPDARCAKCDLPLFSTKHGGKFVTVPEDPSTNGAPPKTYHITCFRCKICDRPFEEREGGRAVFVRGEEGACHIECAPPEKIKVRHVPSMLPLPKPVPTPLPTPKSSNTIVTPLYSSPSISSRYERPPTTAPATTSTFTFPRFGGSTSCPGCSKAVSPMERGVVPGPQGTRWHATCLLCGGKEAKGRRKEAGKPGCGKQLDSAAKTDIDGRVWCRECLLLLPLDMRNVQANMLGPLAPTPTDGRGVAAQSTGTTTLARQFTGMGGGSGNDSAVVRQMTGGGLSPTRQLQSSSPTKLYDGPRPGRTFPRPKSVSGTRSKSDGEGRGMFLVRQLTGGNSGSSANTYGL